MEAVSGRFFSWLIYKPGNLRLFFKKKVTIGMILQAPFWLRDRIQKVTDSLKENRI